LIYPRHIIKENRYRAHGGIIFNPKTNSSTSYMKFNIYHRFLLHQDFQYDSVVYKCNSDESDCMMDLYAVMLNETLHGFGIEVLFINILPELRWLTARSAVSHLIAFHSLNCYGKFFFFLLLGT
jgi:hypothetical protein